MYLDPSKSCNKMHKYVQSNEYNGYFIWSLNKNPLYSSDCIVAQTSLSMTIFSVFGKIRRVNLSPFLNANNTSLISFFQFRASRSSFTSRSFYI